MKSNRFSSALSCFATVCLATVSLLAATGCEEPNDQSFPTTDIDSDIGSDIDQTDTTQGGLIPEGVSVPIDLAGYLEDGSSQASVSLYQVESEDELAEGPAVEARPGDWVLENDRVRLFVEHVDRAMSPCPWGGNIVDAQYKRADGTLTEDVTGEICLMVNVGLTFAPEEFTVVRDGSEGGAAILAVSGRLELLDFLNISAMAADYAPGILDNIALDPDRVIDAKLTRYFILHPGENGVRVVTAIRNESDQTEHMALGHLMRGGAHGNYFNPLNSLGGWGYSSLGPNNLEGDTLPFVAYSGPTAGYAYLPNPDPSLRPSPTALPRGGVQVSVAGVSVSLLGRDSVLETLLANDDRIKVLPGLLHQEPQEVDIVEHWEFFGDEKLSSMVDPIYEKMGVTTGTARGQVTDAEGNTIAGAMVTAIDGENRAMNQTRTDQDGKYVMALPPGIYSMRARLESRVSREDKSIDVGPNADATAHLKLKTPATIDVSVRTPGDEPTSARVMIVCEGSCPDMPTSQERDVTLDSLPSNVARVVSIGIEGDATIEVPAGAYKVVVTRGPEWSVWPSTAPDDGGHAVELGEGESTEIEAEIAHVVDTSGAISADFHVHGVTSPDSIVRKQDRVLSHLGEGVDVLISTDHGFISDYGPEIERQGAGDHIASVVGQEITTPHIGHFNAFPLERDPDHRRGGALDWARGTDYDMTPTEIFAWIDEQDGDTSNDQVKQINHPNSTIPPLKADVLRGITLADPAEKRMDPDQPGATGDDTGLWSDDFTAIEMMNGNNMGQVWTIMRWWLSMVSRGFSPTATAVTDTHKLYSDLGGSPRSFVFVDDAHDTPATFDAQALAAASNQGRLIGSNGPFFRVELENSDGDKATLGETLASTDGDVTARVTVDVPEWLHVDTIDVYSNLPADEIVTAPGGQIEDPIAPTSSHPIDWDQSDLVEAAAGTASHKHWTKTVDIPLTIEEDAYVVIIVRGNADNSSMWPLVPNSGVKPFAFANPVYVDADGGGYDNPPLADLAQTTLEPMMLRQATPAPFEGELTPAKLGDFFEEVGHKH
jgi:hypothetical protein